MTRVFLFRAVNVGGTARNLRTVDALLGLLEKSIPNPFH